MGSQEVNTEEIVIVWRGREEAPTEEGREGGDTDRS